MRAWILAAWGLLAFPVAGQTLSSAETVSLTGSFVRGQVPAFGRAETVKGRVFGEWSGRTQAGGRGATGVFLTPSAIEFEVIGFPKSPGIRIFLEDAVNPALTVDLAFVRNSNTTWHTRQWFLPREWRQRKVRLVVEDRNTTATKSWIGISTPRQARVFDLQKVKNAAFVPLSLVAQWSLLALPGFALVLWCGRKRELEDETGLALLLAAAGMSAFLCFFLYVLDFSLGRAFAAFVLATSLAMVAVFWRQIRPVLRSTLGAVLALWVLCALAYASAGLLYRSDDNAGEQMQTRFLPYQLPPDNLLPMVLAERLYRQEPYRPSLFLAWQSSDRPPLQTGFVLLQQEIWQAPDVQYLLLGILLQTSWIPALWVFLKRAGVRGGPMVVAIAVCGLSQFAFVHGVFVWPKLLAASFGLIAFSSFGWFSARESTRAEAILGGVTAALAMLSHTGVVFTFLGLGIVLAAKRRPTLRWSAMFLATACILYLPWMIYQKFYDPPGDALLKLHLAGRMDRAGNLGKMVFESYQSYGFSGWISAKAENLKFLFRTKGPLNLFGSAGQAATAISELQFFNLVPALGLVNLGFVMRFRSRKNEREIADRMFMVSLTSLFIWFMTMLVPQATANHQNSFLTVLLMLSALALYVAGFSKGAGRVLVLFQLVTFTVFTVFAKPLIENRNAALTDLFPDIGMMGVFAVAMCGVAFCIHREWKREDLDLRK